jgi:hypothetical protein
MERDFYNEDIEQLIKQKADQYKMYPSDKVWKGIHRTLHPQRKWYWLSFLLFLATISYYTIKDWIAPSGEQTATDLNKPAEQQPATSHNDDQQTAVIIPFITPAPEQPGNGPVASRIADAGTNVRGPENALVATASPEAPAAGDNINASAGHETPVIDMATRQRIENISHKAYSNITLLQAVPQQFTITAGNRLPVTSLTQVQEEDAAADADRARINWLHETAAYELTMPRAKRLSWQLSFSPTMNYRKLEGSRYARLRSDVKNIPIAFNIEGDPDNLVNHKPALGFELGSHFLYSISKRVTLRAGLQFNYSRYDIQAYSSNTTERATIALNNYYGVTTDSITNYTNLRNFGGDAAQDLRNQYFQLSAPIGLELRLLGNSKVQVGVAGTVQPTYLLNRNTYLITTDYKNYTQQPSLVRRWNLNTSAEAFIAYTTGDLKWQVGPQFRYQVLSSYVRRYPIAEHLMEFGIKIGVAKNIH